MRSDDTRNGCNDEKTCHQHAPRLNFRNRILFFTGPNGTKFKRYPCIFFFNQRPHMLLLTARKDTPTLDHGLDTHPETDPYLQLSLHDQLSPLLHTGQSRPFYSATYYIPI